MKTRYLLPILLLSASCQLLPVKTIYVATDGDDHHAGTRNRPLQTLEAAKKSAREFRATHPGRSIRIRLGQGIWSIREPLVFESEDGGSNRTSISWEGDPAGNTLISGGRTIENFRDEGFGIWWAAVDSGWKFEQLYVDGKPAIRARTPNLTDSLPRYYINRSVRSYHPDSTIREIFMPVRDHGRFEQIMPSGEFEVVVFKEWAISRFPVSSLNPQPAGLNLKAPYRLFDANYISITGASADSYSCYLEGDPTFIDQPGEWALDQASDRLYYKPYPGQTPDRISVVAPLIEKLVIIRGTAENQVKNLNFRNIRFAHAAYLLPVSGHDGIQAAYYYTGAGEPSAALGLVPPAIEMNWAHRCTFNHCSLYQSGGNGIALLDGCIDNLLDQFTLTDVGGNGIMIGLTRDPAVDSARLPVRNRVTASTVCRAGAAFHGAVGIWLGFGAGNEISESEISDLPYTGISVGWQWNPLPSSSCNNRIMNNHIHHVMQVLGDGGGIYTLGFQPGSVISGNTIHDILRSDLNHASPNNGMFIDEGSRGYRIEKNSIRNTAHTCIRGHRAAGVELTGNIFESTALPAISHTPPYEAMIFANRDTIISWPNPGWPKEWGYPDTVVAFTMHHNTFKVVNSK